MRIKTFFLWVSPLVLASIFLSVLTVRALGARSDQAYWNDTIADRVRLLVGREFVDEIDDERGRELFFAAMEAYLQDLDPYCTFYDPEEREAMEEDTTGHFGGIGVQIDLTDADGPEAVIPLREVAVVVPESGPVGFHNATPDQVRAATYEAFAIEVGKKFHEHERPLQ